MIPFKKMHGCGNDYIYIGCFNAEIENPEELAIRLSDRHKGIGGDGIVLILPSDVADARMRMFNADGSEGRMCGNAIRCVGKYLFDNHLVDGTDLVIETKSGNKRIELLVSDGVAYAARVDMGRAEIISMKSIITCVSMGNPHAVTFCKNVDELQLEDLGPFFEKNPFFPEGVNTEFVQVIDGNNLKMRVWERGSGETLACGTGSCAAVVAAVLNGYCNKGEDVTVHLIGGKLVVNYTDDRVLMTGECVDVFDGEIRE